MAYEQHCMALPKWTFIFCDNRRLIPLRIILFDDFLKSSKRSVWHGNVYHVARWSPGMICNSTKTRELWGSQLPAYPRSCDVLSTRGADAPGGKPSSKPSIRSSRRRIRDIFWLDEWFDHVWGLKVAGVVLIFASCLVLWFYFPFMVVVLDFAKDSSYTLAWKIWWSAPGKPHRWTAAEQCVAWLGVVL